MTIPTTGQVNLLRRGVMRALSESGVNGVEVLTCAVDDFRPISWMAPPIYPLSELDETLPTLFSGYKTLTSKFDIKDVVSAYNFSMKNMVGLPFAVYGFSCTDNVVMTDAFKIAGDLGRVVFSSSYSKVDGLLPEAGITLTFETVAALNNMAAGTLVKDDNNFHIILDDRTVIGIVDGEIHGYRYDWPADLRGQIELQLMSPRGVGWTTKSLDACDRLYFWLTDHPDRVDNIDGVLDALTYLKAHGDAKGDNNFERYLLEVKPSPKVNKVTAKRRAVDNLAKVSAAAEMMDDIRLPDVEKVNNIFALLVPDVMSEAAFNRAIWDMGKPVLTLQARAVSRIQSQLFKMKNKV